MGETGAIKNSAGVERWIHCTHANVQGIVSVPVVLHVIVCSTGQSLRNL